MNTLEAVISKKKAYDQRFKAILSGICDLDDAIEETDYIDQAGYIQSGHKALILEVKAKVASRTESLKDQAYDSFIESKVENLEKDYYKNWNVIDSLVTGRTDLSETEEYKQFESRFVQDDEKMKKYFEGIQSLESLESVDETALASIDWSDKENREELLKVLYEDENNPIIEELDFKKAFEYPDFIKECPASLWLEGGYDINHGLFQDLKFIAGNMPLCYVIEIIRILAIDIETGIKKDPESWLKLLKADDVGYFDELPDKVLKNEDNYLCIPQNLLKDYEEKFKEILEYR